MTHTRIRAAARSIGLATAGLLAALCLLGPAAPARAAGEAVEVSLVGSTLLAPPAGAVRAEALPPDRPAALRALVPVQEGGDLLLPALASPALRDAIGGFSAVQAHALRVGAAALASRTAQPTPLAAAAGASITLPPGLSGAEQQWLTQYYLPLPAPGSPYGVYASAAEQAEADSIFAQVNQFRAKKGAGILRRDAHLDAVAQAHALHMARAGFFEHRDPYGLEVFERVNAAGAPGWRAAGENIAAGQRSAQEVHETWLRSKGHRHNVLSEQYESLGIGAAYVPGTEFGWFWVQVFATFDGRGEARWIEPLGGAATLTGLSGSAGLPPASAPFAETPPPAKQVMPRRYYPSPRVSDDDSDNGACMTGG